MDMGDGRIGLSARYIRQAVEDSLRRLQTDRIDLYQSHEDDAKTPLEETLSAFADLVREGKVRAIGASNYSAPRLAEALATSERLGLPRYESLQPKYNLVDRAAYEADLQQMCLQRGVQCARQPECGVGPHSPISLARQPSTRARCVRTLSLDGSHAPAALRWRDQP